MPVSASNNIVFKVCELDPFKLLGRIYLNGFFFYIHLCPKASLSHYVNDFFI